MATIELFTKVRMNFGCGDFPLPKADGWINIDNDPSSAADLKVSVPPIPADNGSVDEIYAGHFLEHLSKEDGAYFLRECFRVLRRGGKIGILVPDTREIMRRYLAGWSDWGLHSDGRVFKVADLDDVCEYWLFSTVQPSHHQWAYDESTLRRAMERAGFEITGEIDRFNDSRLGTGQWYQCGADGIKP